MKMNKAIKLALSYAVMFLFIGGSIAVAEPSMSDVALFQSNGWWALKYDFNSATNGSNADNWIAFGDGTAQPVVGDFRHTGIPNDVAILQSNGWWALKYNFNSATNGTADKWIAWGDGTAKPVVGDFDHDGFADDVAIFQSNGWWALKYDFVNTTNFAGADKWIAFGDGTAKPVVGDFNHNGFADDVALLQSNGWWAIKYDFVNTTNFAGADKWIAFGNGTAKPVVGDFNHDGFIDDVALLQSNSWWELKYNFNSTSNFAGADKWIAFGDGTAKPVVGGFRTADADEQLTNGGGYYDALHWNANMSLKGYSTVYNYQDSKSSVLGRIPSDTIWMFSGHGGDWGGTAATRLYFGDPAIWYSSPSITGADVQQNTIKLVYADACISAVQHSWASSDVSKGFINQGTKAYIGFNRNVTTGESAQFTDQFGYLLKIGATVHNAALWAGQQTPIGSDYTIYGDDSITI